MEATSEKKGELDSKDKAKEKRSGWSAFYDFVAGGGIMLLVVVIVALAMVITMLIYK